MMSVINNKIVYISITVHLENILYVSQITFLQKAVKPLNRVLIKLASFTNEDIEIYLYLNEAQPLITITI